MENQRSKNNVFILMSTEEQSPEEGESGSCSRRSGKSDGSDLSKFSYCEQ